MAFLPSWQSDIQTTIRIIQSVLSQYHTLFWVLVLSLPLFPLLYHLEVLIRDTNTAKSAQDLTQSCDPRRRYTPLVDL